MKIAILTGDLQNNVDPRILVGLKGCFGAFSFNAYTALRDAVDINPDHFDLLLLAPPFVDQMASKEGDITRVQDFINSLCCTGFPVIAVHYGSHDEEGKLDAVGERNAASAGRLIALAISHFPLTCSKLLACSEWTEDSFHIKAMVEAWQFERESSKKRKKLIAAVCEAGQATLFGREASTSAPSLPESSSRLTKVVSLDSYRRKPTR